MKVAIAAGLTALTLSTAAATPAAPVTPVAAADSIRLTGNLRDTAFAPGTPVRVEVLETGDTAAATAGTQFKLELPRDTVWNLCFSALRPADGGGSGGAPVTAGGRIEKCFEIRYLGTDTAFVTDIGEQPAVLVTAPETPAPIAIGGDTLDADTAASQFKSEDAVQLKKVLVRAQRAPKRSLGKSTVSAKLIKRMPGLAEADVIRSIQSLPGVVSSSDFSTKIYVRGGGSDQNLILLDKAVVYSPVHFFGLFSTFLVEGIDEVNFYKGGFPPEYGNRLSSVLDIKSREGGKDTAETFFRGSSVKISTFASQLHTEGRQGPVRWLVAGRRTYIDEVLTAMRKQGWTDLDLNYFFYDLQGNVHYDFAKDKGLMLSFYNGRDLLDFTPFKVEWGNTVIPLNYDGPVDDHLTTHITASYSHFSQKFGLENIFGFYNRIVTSTYKQSMEYTGIEDHRLIAGVDLNLMETIFRNDQIIAKVSLRDYTLYGLNSLFFQDKWTDGNAELTTGVRLTYATTLDEPGIEPRLSLKYKLPHRQTLDYHVGFYQQYINSIQFQDQENLNEFYYPAKKVSTQTVNPTSSLLFSAGYGADKVLNAWDFTLEGYYKTLNHLSVFAPNDVPDSILLDANRDLGDLFREANGYSYGFEASLRKPDGLLFGGLSYSNGTAVIREDSHKDQPFFPSWHQPHSFKADLAFNFTGKDGLLIKRSNKYLRISSQMKYATGLPYTEYTGYMDGHLLDQNQGQEAGGPNPEYRQNLNLLRGNRNAAFVPAYFRWDLKPIDWGKEGKWNFSWTILNITNHKNIFFYTYNRQSNPPERIEITQFPNFPFLVNYEYFF